MSDRSMRNVRVSHPIEPADRAAGAPASFPSNVAIWSWLVALLVAALLCAYLPFGKALGIFLIFALAVGKAFLVARHYMHLRTESVLIYAIAGVPVLLLLGLMLALVPDIVFRH